MKQSERQQKKKLEGRKKGRKFGRRHVRHCVRRGGQTWVIVCGGGRKVVTALQLPEGKQRDTLGSAPWWDRTQRSGTELHVGRMRRGIGKHSFTMRAVKLWNRLPRGDTAVSGQGEFGQCAQ